MRPAHILIALALISVASAGMPAIQQSSGVEYWVYDIAKCDNGSIIFYVDETTIPRLDKAEGIIFAVWGGL
ncbi:MAG: hypothetical protein QM438_10185 [Euryarchaeota archaeon]|jgi:hypothetical protein|nr:hypothetical protein [Euryarchaeota archaeon]